MKECEVADTHSRDVPV